MIIKSKKDEKSYIEIRERITAGVRDRYLFMRNPKITYNLKGEMMIDNEADTVYESNPNLFLLSKCIVKIVEDGEDKTPKDHNVSSLIDVLDNNFYDSELLNETLKKALEVYNFLEQKAKE